MTSSVAFKALCLCVVLALIQGSYQQELFEDAIELENADPMLGDNFYSTAEERDIPGDETSETAETTPQQSNDDQERSPDKMQPEFYDSPGHSYVNSDGFYVGLNGIDGDSKSNMDREEQNSAPYPESMEDTDTPEEETTDSDHVPERQNNYDNEYVENDSMQKENKKEKNELLDQHADLEAKDRSMAEHEEGSSKSSKDVNGGGSDRAHDMKAKEDNMSTEGVNVEQKQQNKSSNKHGALGSNQERNKKNKYDSQVQTLKTKHKEQLEKEKSTDEQLKSNDSDSEMKHKTSSKGKMENAFVYIDNANIEKKPDSRKNNHGISSRDMDKTGKEFENHIKESKGQYEESESSDKDKKKVRKINEAKDNNGGLSHKGKREKEFENKDRQKEDINQYENSESVNQRTEMDKHKEDKATDVKQMENPLDDEQTNKSKNEQNVELPEQKSEKENTEHENKNEDSLKAKTNKHHRIQSGKDSKDSEWLNYDSEPKDTSEDEKNHMEKSNEGYKQAPLTPNMPSANKPEASYDRQHRNEDAKLIVKPNEALLKDSAENENMKKLDSNEDLETIPESKDSQENVSDDKDEQGSEKSAKDSPRKDTKKQESANVQDVVPLDYALISSEQNNDKESISEPSKKNHEKKIMDDSLKEKFKSFQKVDKEDREIDFNHQSDKNDKIQSTAEDIRAHEKDLEEMLAEEEKPEEKKKQRHSLENALKELPNHGENHKEEKPKNVLMTLPDATPSNQLKNDEEFENKDRKHEYSNSYEHPLSALPDAHPTLKKPKKKDDHIDEIFEQNQNLENIDLEGTNDTIHHDENMATKSNNGGLTRGNSLTTDLEADAASGNDGSLKETTQKQDGSLTEEVKKENSTPEDSGSADFSTKQKENSRGETDEGEIVTKNSDATIDDPVVIIGSKNDQTESGTSEDANQSGSGETPSLQEDSETENKATENGSGNRQEEEDEFSGSDDNDDDSSGAERERRQAFTTEEQINEAKAKLKNAEGASDALTSIEKEMGLDPSIAPEKTKHLTSELHNEIGKFKDIITHQNDAVKKSKFQKLEKLAEEDVKGANDVMKMIVELEVAKYFAKNRARKKLELAMRNRISKPPTQNQSPPEWNPYQGMMPNYMPQFPDQSYAAPYAPYPPPAPIAPIPPMAQEPSQPPSPPQNPLDGRFMDSSFPQSWNPPVSAFIAPQRQPQDFSPYIGTPMNSAPPSLFPNMAPVAFAPKAPVNRPIQSNIAKASSNDVDINAPEQKPELNDEPPKTKVEQFLPKSSPFAGLKPLSLSSFKPIHALHPAPSFSSEMKGQAAPFASLKQNSLSASSLHAFSDDVRQPENNHVKQFFPKSAWIPPARVNTFSDGLSHLNVNYQKPSPSFKPKAPKPAPPAPPPKAPKMGISNLFRSPAKPLAMHQFQPATPFQPPMQQQNYDTAPRFQDAPPMYHQFQIPSPMEPAVPVQQFNPQAPYYPPPPIQQSTYIPGPLPQPPQLPKQADDQEQSPIGMNFNDQQPPQPQQPLAFQGPQVYPQQSVSGFNAYANPGMPVEDYSWPQAPFAQAYGYQPAPSYEQQLVNPLLNEAITKIHDTKKAAQVVQKIENRIGLSPPAVNHIINDVESETKNEKTEFDDELKQEKEKIQNDKKMMDDVPDNNNLKKKIEEEEKKLEDVRKRDEIAKVKLATIRKIEKILTVIETAKYSALKRAREHLLRLKSEKDPQIRKRSLEALERDLHNSEQRHLHRRNEINIWLKGSKNNINTSHFLEGDKKEKKEERNHRFKDFGSPSIPKLAIANFATKYAKKANITLTKSISKKHKIEKPKKEKIGVVLMKKLLQRMDDLYDMQSKILTQLIKEHQRAKDEREHMRNRRSPKKHRHYIHKRHHGRHSRHSKRLKKD